MSGWAQIVTDGPVLAAIAVSAFAGLISFASPCVLPLVPGYLSYVTGLTGTDLEGRSARARIILGSLLFIAGFTVIFVLLGASVGSAAPWLLIHAPVLEKIVGVVVIALGCGYLGWIPTLQREWRLRMLPASGLASGPMVGAIFALGWIPCITPTLAAVQGLAFVEGGAQRGMVLSTAYALGLGVPFVLVAVGMRWMAGTLAFIRRHGIWVTRIGGVFLILVGILLVTGWWADFTIWLRAILGSGQIGL